MGEVVVSLQNVKARAGRAGDDLIFLVEDGRDDGAKLPQAGEEFLFEFARLRGEELHAQVDEVTLPELRRAPSADDGCALKNAHADTCGLQGLGATEAGKARSDNRDGSSFFHTSNVDISVQGAITIAMLVGQASSISR